MHHHAMQERIRPLLQLLGWISLKYTNPVISQPKVPSFRQRVLPIHSVRILDWGLALTETGYDIKGAFNHYETCSFAVKFAWRLRP